MYAAGEEKSIVNFVDVRPIERIEAEIIIRSLSVDVSSLYLVRVPKEVKEEIKEN